MGGYGGPRLRYAQSNALRYRPQILAGMKISRTGKMKTLLLAAFFVCVPALAHGATYVEFTVSADSTGNLSNASLPSCTTGVEGYYVYFYGISLQSPYSLGSQGQVSGTGSPCATGQTPTFTGEYTLNQLTNTHADGVGTYRLYMMAPSAPNACTTTSGSGREAACEGIGAFYYTEFYWDGSIWSSVSPLPPVSTMTITSPTATTYTSNPVTFEGLYTNTALFTQIQFVLTNTTMGMSIPIAPYALPLASTVNATWTVQQILPYQGNYSLKARLYSSISASSTPYTSIVYFGLGSTSTVSTTTQSNIQGSFTPIDCATFDIGCYLKNSAMWIFAPDPASLTQFQELASTTLPTKFPVSWYYEIEGVYSSFSASTSPNMISVTIPLAHLFTATSTPFGAFIPDVTILSTSTISKYLPDTQRNLLLALETAAVWVLFGMYVYRDVQHRWFSH